MANDQQSGQPQPPDPPELAAAKARNALLAEEVAMAENRRKLIAATKAEVADSPELAALKAQAGIVAQQTAIAEGQQKMVAALLPSNVKPLEGSAKIDGDHPIEGQILAYHAINQIAKDLAKHVKGLGVTRVFIHGDSEINLLIGFQSFKGQLEMLRRQLQEEIDLGKTEVADRRAALKTDVAPPTAAAALPAALVVGAAARSAIDLLALFRSDVTLKFKDLTIPDLALIAAVAGALQKQGVVVYHTAMVPPMLFDATSTILTTLNDLHELGSQLESVLRSVRDLQDTVKKDIADLDSQIAAAAAAQPPTDPKPLEARKNRRADALGRLTAVDARLAATATAFAAFNAALVKSDSTGTSSPLGQLLRAEKLATAAGTTSHLLTVKVAAAGGGVKTKQSLFRSARVFHSGGSVIDFILFAPSGEIAAAGTLPYYTGFLELTERSESSPDLKDYRVTL